MPGSSNSRNRLTGEPILPARTANQHLARYWFAVRAGKIGSPVRRFIRRRRRGVSVTRTERKPGEVQEGKVETSRLDADVAHTHTNTHIDTDTDTDTDRDTNTQTHTTAVSRANGRFRVFLRLMWCTGVCFPAAIMAAEVLHAHTKGAQLRRPGNSLVQTCSSVRPHDFSKCWSLWVNHYLSAPNI
jgi:hypothetical protein